VRKALQICVVIVHLKKREMKKLEFKTKIASPKQKVWETMLNPQTFKEWTAESWPGSHYEGKWGQGERIKFMGTDGGGTVAEITEYKPYDYVHCKHVAVLQPGGIEDTTSDVAKGWIGTEESYRFTEKDGKTEVKVEMKANPDWEKMFSDGWPTALEKLKEIAEGKVPQY
jgi:uncharacterized protein YndB with AHSA1/START domain